VHAAGASGSGGRSLRDGCRDVRAAARGGDVPRRRPGATGHRLAVGGFYGLKKGLRGHFGMYLPPLLEELGLAELEHNPRNNRMRAAPTA
jgi:hypothetical protein